MARKDKSKSQPNAPELQQLYQQPPHNPYYPELDSHLSQPPPYSELTVPNSRSVAYQHLSTGPMAQTSGRIISGGDYPRQQVVIHQVPSVSVPYDSRAERYHRKIKSFNNQTCLIAVLTGILSYISYHLWNQRPCLSESFTVAKVQGEEVTIRNMHDAQITIIILSAIIAIICSIQGCAGRSKSYSCYLFLIALLSLGATVYIGYLAYLCFWTTCQYDVADFLSKTAKTVIGSITNTLPDPDKRVFGENNVFAMAEKDTKGLIIFIFNAISSVFYFSVFLAATCSC